MTVYVAPLSRKQINSLKSKTITKVKYDELVEKIDRRFDYVFRTAMEMLGRKVEWYDYDNCGEGTDGYFSMDYYPETIEFTGKFQTPKDTLYPFYLPTSWLWTDFEEGLEKEIRQHKEKLAQKKKAAPKTGVQDKKQIIASIRKKLTKKELSYVSFK